MIRIHAFKKQKEMFLLKRNRMDRLIRLERLEKGENCMSFKEFDLSDYIRALENFKNSQPQTVIQHWGNIANFDLFLQKIKEDEDHVAQLAIRQFGSVEKYTEAMRQNLNIFLKLQNIGVLKFHKKCRQKTSFLHWLLTKGKPRPLNRSKAS